MSKIKFKEDTFIEVCIGFDLEGDPIMEEEKVTKDEEFEVNILPASAIPIDEDDIIQIQFGDGSVAFIPKDILECIKN